ncbi:VIT1/CCC1 transporter family protein [Candidatus Microgenomates bacterium]|nr:VIT1/CCC1 transporter family protein [Candidatus Microgenomates bacterium]
MQTMSVDTQKHLRTEHNVSPFSSYLKEIVYGASDGIVTTFAVVAGFAGANLAETAPLFVVLLFGLANLAADGASMGISSFLSLRAEQDYYNHQRRREQREIRDNPTYERQETEDILIKRGFSKKDAVKITELYSNNPEYWADFMMSYELELANPTGENPFYTGIATTLAFMAFGFIPLIPYVFMRGSAHLFAVSCSTTLTALLLLGILRWRVTKQSFIRSVGEIVLIGSVSAAIAYIVGVFFRT